MRVMIFALLIASSLIAQDFTGIRIYINPGHGGHDSDDRYISETGFWESESNLSKGLALRDILLGMNATIRMSRTTNNSSDDLPLSVIDADANNFDADFFHSIHSNGFDGQSNYTVVFYKEVNSQPVFPQAKTMSNIMKLKIFQANRTTASYSRGDYTFLGFNLGVLRTLNMPGTLSEGSFHDYIPESYRLLNYSYRKHEAWAIARSLVDYFNLTDNGTGVIAGIVRDPQKSVSYYSISGTNDDKKPINFVKATLLPDSLVFMGDDNNNGFYFFDSLTPGNYTLMIEGENYAKDTLEVTAAANTSKFYDVWMYEQPDYSVPNIISYSPANSSGLSLFTNIIIDFDIRMDKASVENAFSTVPSVQGSFSWENNNKRMIFTPNPKWEGNTQYEVNISTAAKSAFGINLDSPFQLTFRTRAKLNLLDVYPAANQTDVSTSVQIIVKFDAPIDAGTLSGNVLFLDPDGNFVPILVEQSSYSQGFIKFEPVDKLQRGTEYSLELKEDIGDTEGLNFGENYSAKFRTSDKLVVNGNVLDDFENTGEWALTTLADVTSGIDSKNTSFARSTDRSNNGSYSGKLKYKFVDSLAAVGLVNSSGYQLNGVSKIGIFVFGDYSFNQLNFIFTDNQGAIVTVPVSVLDYTGWKMQQKNLNDLGFEPQIYYGIQIVRTADSETEGVINIDDLQNDFTTGLKDENLPLEYKLVQNYPNPFNPATTITYSIKEKGFVQLKVYDVLGKEIATLVNKEMSSGNYSIKFSGNNLSSGIYFYTIRVNSFVMSRKMILLK